MSKVYQYSKKIFNFIGAAALLIGVSFCSSTQTTAAVSGETDGVYYSPAKDGRVDYTNNATAANDYDIKVGGAYFDANGNGAEDFYYDETQTQNDGQTGNQVQNINIYNNGSTTYTSGPSTDWGRYDGLDITINNYGWSNPYWRFGYSSYWGWNWGMSWGYGWGYPYYGSYWGWGYPYYGSYWGWGSPYYGYGWGYPYYGYGYGYGHGYNYGGYPYYYRGTAVAPGVRPGSGLSYGNGTPYRSSGSSYRDVRTSGNTNPGNVRTSGIRETRGDIPVRAVRGQNSGVRNTNSMNNSGTTTQSGGVRSTNSQGNINSTNNGNAPVRTGTTGIRSENTGQPNSGVAVPVRQVRPTAPPNTRPNSNIGEPRQNSNIRSGNSNMSAPRSSSPSPRSGNISTPRSSSPSPRVNSGTSTPRSSSPSMSAPSSRGSNMGGGVRSGSGRR